MICNDPYLLTICRGDNHVYIWSIATGKLINQFIAQTVNIDHIACDDVKLSSGTHRLLFTYGQFRNHTHINVWDINDVHQVKRFRFFSAFATIQNLFVQDHYLILHVYNRSNNRPRLLRYDLNNGERTKYIVKDDLTFTPTPFSSAIGKFSFGALEIFSIENLKLIARYTIPTATIQSHQAIFVAGYFLWLDFYRDLNSWSPKYGKRNLTPKISTHSNKHFKEIPLVVPILGSIVALYYQKECIYVDVEDMREVMRQHYNSKLNMNSVSTSTKYPHVVATHYEHSNRYDFTFFKVNRRKTLSQSPVHTTKTVEQKTNHKLHLTGAVLELLDDFESNESLVPLKTQ